MFYRLDFANERITLLEEKLKETSIEKTKDVEIFSNMISMSKFMLVDNLIKTKKDLKQLEQNTIGYTSLKVFDVYNNNHS